MRPGWRRVPPGAAACLKYLLKVETAPGVLLTARKAPKNVFVLKNKSPGG